jgi:hypothetical protein
MVVSSIAAIACAPAMEGMALQPARPHSLEPSLDELARTVVPEGKRALLVVYPRSACSGSARMVFVDDEGTFFGAVGPGQAALLTVPSRLEHVVAISNVEVTAPVGAWFYVDEVHLAPPPSGIILTAYRANARQCGSGQYAGASIATKAEMESALSEAEIQWVQPRPAEGQAWLESRRKRMDELLGRQRAQQPAVVTRRHVP